MEPKGSCSNEMQGVSTFTECKREEHEMECSREASEVDFVRAMDCRMKVTELECKNVVQKPLDGTQQRSYEAM
jgi:hypothetical protein